MEARRKKPEPRKTASQLLSDIAYTHDFSTVFDDFLTMTICALSVGRMEDKYLETAKRYQPAELKTFGNALAALILDYEAVCTPDGSWSDVLGHIFEEHNGKFGRDARGQFFTPEHLCDLMAQLQEGEIPDKDEIKVMDPACGSGRCLIALARLNPMNRFNQFFYGMDLDSRCVKMCVINYVMHGMKGVVIHMDSIAMEVFGGYRIFLPDTGMGIMPLTKSQCMPYLLTTGDGVQDTESKPTQTINKPDSNLPKSGQNRDPQQLSLFF